MRQDSILAGLGLIIGVLMLGMNLVINHTLARTIPPVLILASLAYLAALYWSSDVEPASALFGFPQVGLIVVLFGTAALVVVSAVTGGRTIPFYALASLLGTFLLLQILFTPNRHLHVGTLLVEVVLLASVIRFASLYAVPGFTGIDVWVHVPNLTQRLLETGSVDGMGDSKYVGSPVYHLLTVVTVLFAEVSLRNGLYLSQGIILVVGSVLVYAAMRYLTSARWALFAVATYGLSDYFIRWSIHIIPTSTSLTVFFGVLLLLIRRIEGIGSLREDLLLILLFLVIALTHQLSSVIVLTILGTALLAHVVYTSSLFPLSRAPDVGVITTGVATTTLLSYFVYKAGLLSFVWSQTPYYGRTLLDGAVTTVHEDITTITDGSGESSVREQDAEPDERPLQQFVEYLDWLGYLLLLFGTVVGSLAVSQAKRLTQTAFIVVSVVVVLMAIALVPPVLGIDSLLPGRWYPFLYIGMAMLAAIGFGYLRRELAVPAFVVVGVLFAVIYPGAMIFAPTATPDNPAFEDHSVKYSYTESELVAAQTLVDRTTMDGGGAIFSDHPYVLTLNRLGEVQFGIATIDEDGDATNDRIVYRSYQSTGAPRFFIAGDQHIQQVTEEQMCDPSKHRPYSNGAVTMCYE